MTDFGDSIEAATRQLAEEWRRTQEHWQDRAAETFVDIHLQPLLDEAHSFLVALDRLEECLFAASRVSHIS
jgi:hypothetical protein